jgi:hypothetical protein
MPEKKTKPDTPPDKQPETNLWVFCRRAEGMYRAGRFWNGQTWVETELGDEAKAQICADTASFTFSDTDPNKGQNC